MAMDFLYPDYEVQRNYTKCIGCLECTKKCPSPCIDLFGPETIV